MSTNYSLASPIDVKSTTVTGTLNVYNPARTNYNIVSAPSTLSSNVDFTLPTTVGVNGQYLQRTGTTSLGWNRYNAGYFFPISSITVSSATTQLITTTSATFVNVTYIPFPGTSAVGGNTPSAIYAVVGATNNTTTSQIRISDVTNATIIVTGTTPTYTANTLNLFNLGALSNVTTTAATWQLLIRRNSGTGTINFYFFMLLG